MQIPGCQPDTQNLRCWKCVFKRGSQQIRAHTRRNGSLSPLIVTEVSHTHFQSYQLQPLHLAFSSPTSVHTRRTLKTSAEFNNKVLGVSYVPGLGWGLSRHCPASEEPLFTKKSALWVNPPSGLWAACAHSREDTEAPNFIRHLSNLRCFNLINISLQSASGNYL